MSNSSVSGPDAENQSPVAFLVPPPPHHSRPSLLLNSAGLPD